MNEKEFSIVYKIHTLIGYTRSEFLYMCNVIISLWYFLVNGQNYRNVCLVAVCVCECGCKNEWMSNSKMAMAHSRPRIVCVMSNLILLLWSACESSNPLRCAYVVVFESFKKKFTDGAIERGVNQWESNFCYRIFSGQWQDVVVSPRTILWDNDDDGGDDT